MGRSGKYRARHTMSQSEKSYIKTTPWPLAACDVDRQALHIIGRGWVLWISWVNVPV